MAVVSSSRNCRTVLGAAGLADRFDAVVDGVYAAENGLHGKPAPDTFLRAAALLKVTPDKSAVFEDAISGIEAARAGALVWWWRSTAVPGIGRYAPPGPIWW